MPISFKGAHFPQDIILMGFNEMDPPLCGAAVIRQNSDRDCHYHAIIGGERHEART